MYFFGRWTNYSCSLVKLEILQLFTLKRKITTESLVWLLCSHNSVSVFLYFIILSVFYLI